MTSPTPDRAAMLEPSGHDARPAAEAAPLVLLVGNPNAGKTTLFNRLTGQNARIGNYPGVTVERRSGELALGRRGWSRSSTCPARTR